MKVASTFLRMLSTRKKSNYPTKSRINVIAVKKGREKDENILKLVELYHTPKVQEFIKENLRVPR